MAPGFLLFHSKKKKMKYPNLRYGNPEALRHWMLHYGGVTGTAKYLKRTTRTISNWLNYRERMPWWVPEILRLKAFEHAEQLRLMGAIRSMQSSFGAVPLAAQHAANDELFTPVLQLGLFMAEAI